MDHSINLKYGTKKTYLQNGNRLTDTHSRPAVVTGREEGKGWNEGVGLAGQTVPVSMGKQPGPDAQHGDRTDCPVISHDGKDLGKRKGICA